MLRIGICDDQSEARFSLHSLLERILERRGIDGQIYEFSSGEGLLKWIHSRAGETDLLFLDIEMGNALNGMETARQIRKLNQSLILVFVTGYADYVFDGYSVGALDYLLKPVREDLLDSVMARALSSLHLQQDDIFLCRNADGIYRIPKQTISYFSSERRLITCHTEVRDILFYGKLDEIADQIGTGFVRVHQRYLVRADAVTSLAENKVWLSSNVPLPMSRAYKQSVSLALARALLSGKELL